MSNTKSKKKIKFSLIFSLFFLFFLTLLFAFILIISFKPVKLDILNYFDRESEIFKKTNIKEVGSIYISFNKVNKNFELLVEDLVIGKSYFPTILVGVELTLTNEFFKTSLKIFDGDIEVVIPKNTEVQSDNANVKNIVLEKINSLKKFKNIELINNKFKIQLNEKESKSYNVDLNIKESDVILSISEGNFQDNYFSLSLIQNNGNSEVSLDFKKFNFDFIKYFTSIENVSFQKLFLSGNSKFIIKDDKSFDDLTFNLIFNGNVNYKTFKGEDTVNFKNSKVYGEKNKEDLDIIFNIPHYETSINVVARINLKEKQNSKVFVNLDIINVSKLLDLWPNDFQNSVYFWMDENSKGVIQDLSITSNIFDPLGKLGLNDLRGNFRFSKTQIEYMDSMPKIIGISGQAEIKENKIIFSVEDGHSNGLKIEEGKVELFDLDTDVEKASINIDIFASNQKVINYLQTSPINPKSYSKLRKISGENSVNLKLNFPLLVDLPTEKIKYESQVSVKKAVFKNIYKDFNIENFEINIQIDNSKINYSGSGDLFGRFTQFKGKQVINNEKVTEIITGHYDLNGSALSSMIPEIDFSFDGSIDIKYTINEDEHGFSRMDGMGILDDLSVESKFLGPNLNLANGKMRFLIRPYDKFYSGFLDIKARDLEVEINTIFAENQIIELDVNRLKSPQQDFRFNYKSINKEFLVSGSMLTLDKVNISEESNLDYEDMRLNLEIDLLKLGGMYFPNPEIRFIKVDGIFNEMLINLEGKDDFHRIKINDENQSKKFILESNYIPGLLNIFDVDLNINKGSLKIEGERKNNSDDYEGAIAGKNIVFYDAPFLANFFSIFSLDGFAQKMKDGGIIFNEFNADYKFKDNKIKFVDSLLTGSELGIQFDSVVGLNDDYFLLNGSIIPAYTINTLITKFPIVGDIITAGSPEDGLIGANFRVEKIDGEYEVFYNPISVFVPNIIKNFLSD